MNGICSCCSVHFDLSPWKSGVFTDIHATQHVSWWLRCWAWLHVRVCVALLRPADGPEQPAAWFCDQHPQIHTLFYICTPTPLLLSPAHTHKHATGSCVQLHRLTLPHPAEALFCVREHRRHSGITESGENSASITFLIHFCAFITHLFFLTNQTIFQNRCKEQSTDLFGFL